MYPVLEKEESQTPKPQPPVWRQNIFRESPYFLSCYCSRSFKIGTRACRKKQQKLSETCTSENATK